MAAQNLGPETVKVECPLCGTPFEATFKEGEKISSTSCPHCSEKLQVE